jgi:sugar phosphate isomerase/epimerase
MERVMMESRRTFLTTLGAAAAAVSLPGTAAAMDPLKRRGGPQMHLSLAAYSFRKYLTDYRRKGAGAAPGEMTLEDFVDLCAEYGLPGTEPTSYYVPDPLPDGYLQRLRRRAFLAGLTVSGTAIGNTFTHPPGPERDREIAYTKLWIDRAVDMGAPTIRIFAGEVQDGTTEAQARQWCLDAIRECCDYAGVKGVILALENHGGIVSTAEQLVSIVREVDSEWFGVTWDSGNFRSGDPYAELAMAAPYAVTAQVKTRVSSPQGSQPADLARIVKILQDVNYRGWLALEYSGPEEPKVAVPKYLEELRRLTAPASRVSSAAE